MCAKSQTKKYGGQCAIGRIRVPKSKAFLGNLAAMACLRLISCPVKDTIPFFVGVDLYEANAFS